MQLADWSDPPRATIAFCLEGSPPVLVLMNGEPSPVKFVLPAAPTGTAWRTAFDSGTGAGAFDAAPTEVALGGGTLLVFEALPDAAAKRT
jgi:hypothetical protein